MNRSKFWIFLSIGLVVILLLSGACAAGFVAGRVLLPQTMETPVVLPNQETSEPYSLPPVLVTEEVPADLGGTPEELQELFKPFWETWQIVNNQYVDQPIDTQKLMEGAIQGMVDALGDQHTSYMNPDQYRQANVSLEGEYEGIGAWVDPNAEYLTIVSPMPGSPAEEAGLQPGDQIIAVDGENMTGVDGNLVIRKVIGPRGSKVVLTILREGVPEPFDLEITRARIVLPSLETRILEDTNIAYLRLYDFGDSATDDVRDALRDLLKDNPDGLVFDLRGNGGGYLSAAVDIASEFVKNGIIVYEEYGNGERDSFEATGNGLATDIPLVVLVDEGSASASEIVAGAIQDYERAPLVGTTTFGKGSVQIWTPLKDDAGAVRVTVARWLTPDERQIHEVGLEPDYTVEFSEEDIANERDVQLEKAVEVLQELITAMQ